MAPPSTCSNERGAPYPATAESRDKARHAQGQKSSHANPGTYAVFPPSASTASVSAVASQSSYSDFASNSSGELHIVAGGIRGIATLQAHSRHLDLQQPASSSSCQSPTAPPATLPGPNFRVPRPTILAHITPCKSFIPPPPPPPPPPPRQSPTAAAFEPHV
ncbi:hypothetical protein BDV98DRAFT_572408 [Pterulicium gracile]|uniref:Uncharacterized protein n=1 Tax=Pterulicium gracile TaxID=1884261 RepID=A0A5C3Q9C7_9AGAR|nr:hypothetical protein BDV98DRAFT_572408 [Pterula gracilis]